MVIDIVGLGFLYGCNETLLTERIQYVLLLSEQFLDQVSWVGYCAFHEELKVQ